MDYCVRVIVKKYRHLSPDDVRQDLYFVFARCIRLYAKKKGTFKSYFFRSVLNSVSKFSLKGKIVSLPTTFLTYNQLERRGEYVPATAADLLRKAQAKYEALFDVSSQIPTPLEEASLNERQRIVQQALTFLPFHYSDILRRYYGIGVLPRTSQEIADEDGVARQRIDQIRKQAMYHIAKILNHYYKDGSF